MEILGTLLVLMIVFLKVLSSESQASPSSTRPEFFRSTLTQPSRPIIDREGRLRGIHSPNETDFLLGVLIPVHNPVANSSGGRCGNTLTARGVQRVEVTLYAIDRINSDHELLPNLTLGYDIRDTCFSENIALDETIDILVEESELQLESCDIASTNAVSESFLLGMVGSVTSGESVAMATTLRLFMITQVSYLSTSILLNNRDRYRYFLRTVPPDNIQAAAMYQLALRFDWTLVSTIHSNDPYGSYGIREFRKLSVASNKSVCIDFEGSLDVSFTEEQYNKIALRFVRESQANVVVLFSGVTVANEFLKALENTRTQRKFLFLASDAIAGTTIIRFSNLLSGMFAFFPHSEPFAEFETFFSTVTLSNNERNRKWYKEACESRYPGQCLGNSSVTRDPQYVPDASGSLLVDAIYSFAYGIDRFLKENCAKPVVWNRTSQTCQGQNRTLTRNLLLEYVQKSNFQSPTGFRVMFDENGNRESLYSIYNLQSNGSSGYNYLMVGTYDPVNGSIRFNTNHLQLGPTVSDGEEIQSQCRVCDPGSIFMPVQGSCCGTCHLCLGNTSTVTSNSTSATTCSKCGLHQWGNTPLNGSTSCQPLEESFINYSDVWGAIIIVLSILGLLVVIAVCIGMGVFWNTPVIKSSGREQMVVLLIGLICCFLLPYFYIIKPSLGICIVQRLGLWFCFPLVFGALLVKLIRIARIFLQRQKAGRPRFIEPYYQVIFTVFIVAGQMILAVISLIVVHPNTTTDVRSNPDDSNDFPTLILTCQPPHLALLILLVLYDTILIILNNILAVFTIRFPENFNEARHVSFSTFAIGVVWLGFIPSYFATQIEHRAGVVGFGVLMSAFAVLLCLFGPRLTVAIIHHKRRGQNGGRTVCTTSSSTFQSDLKVETQGKVKTTT